jgi:hypothetical protein
LYGQVIVKEKNQTVKKLPSCEFHVKIQNFHKNCSACYQGYKAYEQNIKRDKFSEKHLKFIVLLSPKEEK